jgi:uncharacterized protein YjiS (DUF1127 family)
MRFESEWPGDAIAAPIWGMYDREDVFFESLGGRSWNRVDRRSDQADADPMAVVLKDWRDTVINLAPGISAQSSQRRLQPAGDDTDTAPTDFAGWRAWMTPIVSIVAEFWSRMLRKREIRRITAGWEMIDDRTLKDIGISRCEIEYGRDVQHWS